MNGTKDVTKSFNWCEHCGSGDSEMLGQHIAIETDGVNYCITCAQANGDLTSKEADRLLAENEKLYISWLKSELKRFGIRTQG